jgi:segregation and condensation protein B
MSSDGSDRMSRAVECLLFASPEALSRERLADILEVTPEEAEAALEALRERLDGCGLQVVALAGGYHLATRPEYADCVHRLLQPAPARLSPQALETLALIAYRQPITRPEIDAVRGVNSQHAIASLLEKGLVTTVGRRDAPGRPVVYATTPHFLSTFGLKELGELPNLEQLRQAAAQAEPFVLAGVVTASGLVELEDDAPLDEGEDILDEPTPGQLGDDEPSLEPDSDEPASAPQ